MMKSKLFCLILAVVCLLARSSEVATRAVGDVLWSKCTDITTPAMTIKNVCVNLKEGQNCALNMALTVGSSTIFSEDLNTAVTPRACGTYSVCSACVALQQQSDGVTDCANFELTCGLFSPYTYQFGCFQQSILNDIINCQNRNCPNDCSGHGTCDTNTGQCKCTFGYWGVDCSSIKPLFEQCVRVEQISNDVCVRMEFTDCFVTLKVTAGIIPVYTKQYPVSQLKEAFRNKICFDALGCQICLGWSNLVLNDTAASGCATGTFTCGGIEFGSYPFGCFSDNSVVPQCFGRCPNDCSGHGQCVNAFCKCEDGFEGEDCSTPKSCPSNCAGHGVCSKGKCLCNTNWNGTDCTVFTGKPQPPPQEKQAGTTGIIVIGSLVVLFLAVGAGVITALTIWLLKKRKHGNSTFRQLDLLVNENENELQLD